MMAKNSGGPYKKRTLLEDTINGTVKEKEKKQENKESTSKYDGLSTASDFSKITPKKTTDKKTTTKSTAPAVFKPRTLLETTTRENKGSNRQNTNNRFESRFTPSTVKKTSNAKKDVATSADSLSAIGRFNSLTADEVERARVEEQNREEERKKQYEQDSVKASNFWQEKQKRDTTESSWRPEFDRTGAYKKDSDNDEVNELAKDPKKLKIADGSKEAEYYVKGWDESQKDYKHEALYLDKRTDRDNEVPLSYVMNQSEYDALMYVRGKYGDDEAERFLKVSGIQDRKIKAEYDVKYREQMIQQGKERPVASLLGTVVSAVPHAAAGVSYTLKKMANERAGYEKHDTSSEEDWFNNNVQDLWQEGRLLSTDDETIKAIYTGADMVARNLVEMSTGGAVGKLAKGLGAGKRAVEAAKIVGEGVVAFGTGSADKYTEQAQYGTLGKKGSVSTGVIAGAMDALSWGLMRKGTDKLAGKMLGRMSQGALKTVLSNTVGSVLSGAGIGVTRQTIDNLSDHFIMQNNSKYDVLVKNFQQNGMGQDEAEKNAFIEAYVRPMGSAIMAGGLLSVTMTAYGTVRNAVSFTMRGAKVKNDLYNIKPKDISNEDIDRSVENAVIKYGLKQDKNSDAYKNAKLLENKVNNKRVLSNSEIGAQDILNQIEEFKTYEYADAMSELTGARIELDADLPPEADGGYSKGTIKVSSDNDADKRTILDHEFGHLAEDGAGDIYNAYKARLKDNVTFTKVTNKIKSQYDRLGKNISQELLESEASAEISRLLMPKTADDVRRLIRRVEGNPTLYDRIHNGIRALRTFMYAKGKKTFVDPETGFKMNYGEMLKLEKTLEDALVKVRGAELSGGAGKFSLKNTNLTPNSAISFTAINNYVSVAKNDAVSLNKLRNSVDNELKAKSKVYENKATGYKAKITQETRRKILHPTQNLNPYVGNYILNLNAAKEIDKLFENAVYIDTFGAGKGKQNNPSIQGYHYFVAPVEMDNKPYRAIITAREKKNSDVLYAVNVEITPITKGSIPYRNTKNTVSYGNKTFANISISDLMNNVNLFDYKNNQNKTYTGNDVHYRLKSPDVITYGKNVENVFRDMRLSNVTDDEIKGFAGVTRQMIDYVINARDYSADDFVTQLDEAVDAEVSKGSRSIGETIDITNTIIYEIRHISLADIGKREASAYTTMQMEAAAGRATGEVYANAKAELDDLRKRKAIITGVFSEPPKNRGEYALSSVGKKSYKIMPDAKNKAEFDAAVEDRLDKFVYRVTSNEESGEYGMKYVATHDNDDTQAYLENKTAWDEYDMATAAALVGEFNALGESERASEVLSVLSARATQAGKTAQATSHVYKLNALGKIEWWIKSNERATERDINSRANKNALNAKKAECQAADARERAAAKELLSESDTEYRKLEDEESRLKRDLAARNDGKKKALQLQIALEERRLKADNDAKIISSMLDADARAKARGTERVREERHRELLKKLELGDDEINRIIDEAKKSPEEYDEFFMLMDAYYKVSGREAKDILKEIRSPKDRQKLIDALKEQKALSAEILKEIENEYGTVKKPSEYESEMKALRRKVLEIRKAKRMLEDNAIMTVIRVNDDGEIDPDGEHYVSTNPDATAWEAKKATGKRGNKDAKEHFKSHLDEFYETAGIRHVAGEKLELLKDYASAVHDIDDVDDMLDVIMDFSKLRNTATGSWREALSSKTDEIRSKMYRGIEKLGRSQDGGKVKAKEHNPIKRNLKKAFGDDVEALREIAVSQMFGLLSDVEARDLGAKAKTGMFICHLMNGATTFRNILSNAAESGRMGLFVNNLGALIERTFTPHGERTIGFENPFSGAKAGWERMRLSRLETALNVDILKNDTSRLGTPLKKRTFTKGPMAVLERGLGYILGATDEYFKGATEYQVKQGLKRYVDNGRITQAEADKYAEEQMLYRTFQNDSKIAEFSKDIRNAFNRWGIGEADENGIKPFGVGDFINAYPLVSGNVLDRVIDVTPVGALKAIYNSYKLAESTYKNKRDIKAIEMPIGGKVSDESKTAAAEAIKTNHDLKRKTILSISSALTNGAMIWAGMALFKNGIITGNPSANEEEDYERAKNNSQYGINISRLGRLLDGNDDGTQKNGDLVMPVGFLGNIYMGLSVGAELVQGNEQEMNFLDNYFSANVMSAKEQFLSMSMISNINRTVNNFKYADSVGEGAVATLADVGMMGMPSVVRQFSNAMDDYGRDPYKGATYLDIISGKFKSKIPKVREGEPLRIDLFGEAEVHTLGNKWADIGNNMLSPGIISKYETNVVTDELDKLTAKNKDLLKEILPKTPYRNNTGEFENGQPYSFKLDDENYEKYANILGMTTYKAMHTLVTSDDYKHLTDTQKTTALAEISKESAELVKEIWVSHQQGVSDSSMQKRIDKYVASNEAKASKVVKTDNALKYIKLDGVKVEDVIDAGYRVPYTEEEKVKYIGERNDWIKKIKNGTYYKSELGGKSSNWSDNERQKMIKKYLGEMEDVALGVEEKWVSIEGEWKELSDEEKGILVNYVEKYIDKVRLPDNVGSLVDTSVETEPVDLTYPFVPRNSNIINTGWRADEYDREQAEEKKAEAAEEEDAKPESKSVEEYLSEYKGSGGGNSGYSRNYSKKSYNNGYGGGYSSGSSYRFTPSVQPVQKNTYRFTPRFGGSGSRFGKKF